MTEHERAREIERLEEWVSDMEYMLEEDGTVPENMVGTYERQLQAGIERLMSLKVGADG